MLRSIPHKILRASSVCYCLPATKRSYSWDNYSSNEHTGTRYPWTTGLTFVTMLTSGSMFYAKEKSSDEKDIQDEEGEEEKIEAGQVKKDLPEYSTEEVEKHKTNKSGIWVYYKHGVYDITDFIESHPGGEKRIMLAAGGNIEPYWKIYAQHHSSTVYEILESYRIGNLSDYEERKEGELDDDDPFKNEPERNPVLIVNSKFPFNAETPLILLNQTFITPTPIFYVRNHLPVPVVDPESYKLEVRVNGETKSYSLEDLKKFQQHTVTATIQCAGNRRDELDKVETVKGLTWKGGAIGNAMWTGVLLRDVLSDAGYKPGDEVIKQHCAFQGLDGDGAGTFYGASVPMRKVMDQYGDVLLAFEMNGEELSRDHGYPVRVIVPGVVGARNVKWLGKIIVSDSESDSHWQKKDYKSFSPAVTFEHIPWDSAPAIQEMPVQSLICDPSNGTTISDDMDEIEVKGYAWSGGGHEIIRVDICVNGDTWYEAEIEPTDEENSPSRVWSWKLWTATIPIPEDLKGNITITCRAVDNAYNTQPATPKSIWNVRGLNNNACHSIVLSKE